MYGRHHIRIGYVRYASVACQRLVAIAPASIARRVSFFKVLDVWQPYH